MFVRRCSVLVAIVVLLGTAGPLRAQGDREDWKLVLPRGHDEVPGVVDFAFSPSGDLVVTGGKEQAMLWSLPEGVFLRSFPLSRFGQVQVDVSPDGTRLLAVGDMGYAAVRDLATGDSAWTVHLDYPGWEAPAGGAFGPRGRTVLLVDHGGRLSVRDAEDGEVLLDAGQAVAPAGPAPPGDMGPPVPAGALSDDGRRLVVVRPGGRAQVLDVPTGGPVEELGAAGEPVVGAVFVGGGRLLIVRGDGTAELRRNGESLWRSRLVERAAAMGVPRRSRNGERLLVRVRPGEDGSEGEVAAVLDLETGRTLATLSEDLRFWVGEESTLADADLSPDGTRLLAVGRLGVHLLDVDSGRLLADPRLLARVLGAGERADFADFGDLSASLGAFTPGGRVLLSGTRRAVLRDVDGGEILARLDFAARFQAAGGVEVGPEGELALARDEEGWDRWVWELASGRTVVRGGHGVVAPDWSAAAFSPELGVLEVVALPGGERRALLAADGFIPRERLTGDRNLALTAGGARLAMGLRDSVVVWDVASGEIERRLPTRLGMQFLRTSPRGELLGVMGRERGGDRRLAVQLWSLEDGRRIQTVPGGSDLSFSPSGAFVAVPRHGDGGCDGTDILRLGGRSEVAETVRRVEDRCEGTFVRDEAYLAWSLYGDTTALWLDLRSDRSVQVPPGGWGMEWGGIDGAVVSPGGDRLLLVADPGYSGEPGHAELWSVSPWERLASLDPGGMGINSASFSPDGGVLLTVEEGWVVVRDGRTGGELFRRAQFVEGGWLVRDPAGGFDGSRDAIRATHLVRGTRARSLESELAEGFRPGLAGLRASGAGAMAKADAESAPGLLERARSYAEAEWPQAGLVVAARARTAASLAGDERSSARAAALLGELNRRLGRREEGIRAYEEAAVALTEGGRAGGAAEARLGQARALHEGGRSERALEAARAALDLLDERADGLAWGRARRELGMIHDEAGRSDSALVHYRAALRTFRLAGASDELRATFELSGLRLMPPVPHSGGLTRAYVAGDGALAVTHGRAEEDTEDTRVWEAGSGREVVPFGDSLPDVQILALDEGASLFLTGRVREAAGTPVYSYRIYQELGWATHGRFWNVPITGLGWEAVRVRSWPSGRHVASLDGPADDLVAARFSPDGSRLLTRHGEGGSRLWDARTGALLHAFPGRAGEQATDVESWPEAALRERLGRRFSADGSRVVLVGEDGVARIRDVGTGEVAARLELPGDSIESASFGPGGFRVLTISATHELSVWEASAGRILWRRPHPDGATSAERFLAAGFAGDGRRVVLAEWDANPFDAESQRLTVLDAESGDEEFVKPVSQALAVPDIGRLTPLPLALSPDGSRAATVHGDVLGCCHVVVWRLDTGREVSRLGGAPLADVRFGADGETLVLGRVDGTAERWDATLGLRAVSYGEAGAYGDFPVRFSGDGTRLLSHGGRTIDLRTGVAVDLVPEGAFGHGLTSHGRELWWRDMDSVVVRRLPDGEVTFVQGLDGGKIYSDVSFSEDGRRLAVAWTRSGQGESSEGVVRIHSRPATSGPPVELIHPGARATYFSATFSPDARRLATAGGDSVLVWDAASGRRLHAAEAPDAGRAVFSPDGRHLSFLGERGMGTWIDAWVKETGSWRTVTGEFDYFMNIRPLGFSPDGRWFAYSPIQYDVQLYDLESLRHSPLSLPGPAEALAFSPDGRILSVGSDLFDLVTGERIASLLPEWNPELAAAFSPDGRLAALGHRGTVRFYRTDGGTEVLQRRQLGLGDWVAAAPDGRFDGSEGGLRTSHFARGLRTVPLPELAGDLLEPGLVTGALGTAGVSGEGEVADAASAVGEAAEARVLYRKALEAKRSGDRAEEAGLLGRVAEAYLESGLESRAVIFVTDALRAAEGLEEPGLTAHLLTLLGRARVELSDGAGAEPPLSRALDLWRGLGEAGRQMEALTLLSRARLLAGRAGDALRAGREAVERGGALADPELEGEALFQLGRVHERLGRDDSAAVHYRAAIETLRDGGRPGKLASALTSFAARLSGSDPDSARAYYRDALAAARAAADRTAEGAALAGIGETYVTAAFRALQETGSRWGGGVRPALEAAADTLLLAWRLRTETGDRRGRADLLQAFGVLNLVAGTPQPLHAQLPEDVEVGNAVFDPFKEAVEIYREVDDPWSELEVLQILAQLHRWSDRKRTAAAYLGAAGRLVTRLRRGAGADRDRLSFGEGSSRLFAAWAATWLDLGEEVGREAATAAALAAAERGRARALLDLMRPTGEGDETPGDEGADGSRAPDADGGESDLALAEEGRRLAGAATRSGDAALVYLLAEGSVITWLALPDGEISVHRTEAPLDSVAALVSALRLGLRDPRPAGERMADRKAPADLEAGENVGATRGLEMGGEASVSWEEAASRLSALVLPRALRERLPQGGELVISPQGPLAQIPFAVLPVDSAGPALGERFALRYTPSLSALAEAERGRLGAGSDRIGSREALDPARLRAALVLGDPVMPLVYRESGDTIRFDRLSGAEAEGREVAAALGADVLTGAAASESAVRRRIAAAPLVHLATHGFAYSSGARARESFVALAPDDAHDGLLTVGEIVDELDLAAELVVLSACATGLGNVTQSEGTVGLQRALLAKGARSVVVSLWNVSDAATRALMGRFYHHWLDTDEPVTKAEALRRAKAEIREDPRYEHPRFWAAFQIVGAR